MQTAQLLSGLIRSTQRPSAEAGTSAGAPAADPRTNFQSYLRSLGDKRPRPDAGDSSRTPAAEGAPSGLDRPRSKDSVQSGTIRSNNRVKKQGSETEASASRETADGEAPVEQPVGLSGRASEVESPGQPVVASFACEKTPEQVFTTLAEVDSESATADVVKPDQQSILAVPQPNLPAADAPAGPDSVSNKPTAPIAWEPADAAGNTPQPIRPPPQTPRPLSVNPKAIIDEPRPEKGPPVQSAAPNPESPVLAAPEDDGSVERIGTSEVDVSPPDSGRPRETVGRIRPESVVPEASDRTKVQSGQSPAPIGMFQEQATAIGKGVEESRPAETGKARSTKEGRRLDVRATALSATRDSLPPGASDGVEAVRGAGARGGTGDGAASAIARFLVSDDGVNRSTDTGARQPISPAVETRTAHLGDGVGSSSTARAGFVRPTDTVAEILASTITRGDSIEGASRVLSAGGGSGRHQVVLQLDPPELGQLRLEIRMNQAAMDLRVNVENAAVARLVESRLPELKNALVAHGIRVDHAEIQVRAPESSGGGPRQDEHRPAADGSTQGFADRAHDGHSGESRHAWHDRESTGGDATGDWSGRRAGESEPPTVTGCPASVLTRTSVDVTA